ncbi:hypothetical protein U5N28_07915 [Lysinibacillus telephonicus]|uniref:Uncharacterized protein n=1 Tax=Lysinibacillus telephonicus TaxID=1714840 RepID=A0A3S0HZ81_9BACI|nr:hypothetical protein [Lysinibacillus telephonicus]RTQ91188.1 hypothetical protein EKG35_13795 [Lysinibacillus telephonicus]
MPIKKKLKNTLTYEGSKKLNEYEVEKNGLIFKLDGKVKVVSNIAVNKQLNRNLNKLGIKELRFQNLHQTHEAFSVQYVFQ